MRSLFMVLVVCMSCLAAYAQQLQEIKLNDPDKGRGTAVIKALSDRVSVREFNEKALDIQDLSDLLWAANGINRPDGRRTAPTASNKQEIDVYAILPEGAYLYDAEAHSLKPIEKGDFRALVAGPQEFAQSAPISLVIVANLEKLGDATLEQTRLIAAVDVGIVCQNINIFCSAVGFANVPRATMNKAELQKVLKLSETQIPLMNNPLGYQK
jgi:Nitroreductase